MKTYTGIRNRNDLIIERMYIRRLAGRETPRNGLTKFKPNQHGELFERG